MERVAGFWRHIYAEHVPEEAQWVFQKRIKRTWQRLSQKHSRIGIFLSFAYYRIRRGICFHCLLTVRPSSLLLINTHGKVLYLSPPSHVFLFFFSICSFIFCFVFLFFFFFEALHVFFLFFRRLSFFCFFYSFLFLCFFFKIIFIVFFNIKLVENLVL
jgi:hypothetical protein